MWKKIQKKWNEFWIEDEYDYSKKHLSQTSIRISKSPGEKEGTAEIERGKGIVSVHRMKKLFCDDCIESMLKTVQNQTLEELVILDTENDIFIPWKKKMRYRLEIIG